MSCRFPLLWRYLLTKKNVVILDIIVPFNNIFYTYSHVCVYPCVNTQLYFKDFKTTLRRIKQRYFTNVIYDSFKFTVYAQVILCLFINVIFNLKSHSQGQAGNDYLACWVIAQFFKKIWIYKAYENCSFNLEGYVFENY